MSADIPTPFNLGRTASGSDPLFDSNDTSDGGVLDLTGGDATGAIKTGGGLPSDEGGMQYTIISGKAGTRHYFNAAPSAEDFTETGEKRILLFGAQANAGNRRQLNTFANEGQNVKMYSGVDTTSEIREWTLGGSDTLLANRTGLFLFAIDPESAGSKADVGSFDPADILRYGHFINHGNMVGGSTAWWFWCSAVLVSSEKTSADIPRIHGASSWQDLVDAVQGTTDFTGQNHIYVERSGDVISLSCPCSIGDASQPSPVATTFDDGGVTIVSPTSAESVDPRFYLTNDSMRFYVDLRNDVADTAIFSGTYIWGTEAPFDFSQSDLASITLSNANFSGMGEFTCGSSVSGFAIFSLSGSNKVLINGANLDGSTINGDADLQGGAVTTLTDLTVTGVLDFDTAGIYVLDGCTINEATNLSGGSVTLNLVNGAVLTTNTGPNIAIEENVTVTSASLIDGTRVQLWNTTKAVELDNSLVSGGSGYSYVANLQSANVDDGDTLRLRAAYTSGVTAKNELEESGVITTGGLAFISSQEDNATYNAWGLDGSLITKFSADYLDDEVDITVASDFELRELGAWWEYNLTTSQGISDFFNALNLVDEANLLIHDAIVDIKLDNTTATNVAQTDNRRLYRDDLTRPVKAITTGGGGIDVEWRSPVLLANSDQIQTDLTSIEDKVDIIDTNVDEILLDTDELQQNQGDWLTATGFSTFDPSNDTVANVTLVDTCTTNTDQRGTDGANTVAPDNAGITQIQTDISNLNDPTVQEIVDGVWDEPLTGATHNDPTSAGRRLRQASVWLSAEGELVGTPTTTVLGTNLAQATSSFYADQTIVLTSGTQAGQARIILSYNGTTKEITVDEPFTSAPIATDEFAIFANHVHTVTQIQDGLATEANATANKNEIITEVDANETKIDTIQSSIESLNDFDPVTDVVTTDAASRDASKADLSDVGTRDNQSIINENVKKSSKLIPASGNLPDS